MAMAWIFFLTDEKEYWKS